MSEKALKQDLHRDARKNERNWSLSKRTRWEASAENFEHIENQQQTDRTPGRRSAGSRRWTYFVKGNFKQWWNLVWRTNLDEPVTPHYMPDGYKIRSEEEKGIDRIPT